jgi:hypothetical protein
MEKNPTIKIAVVADMLMISEKKLRIAIEALEFYKFHFKCPVCPENEGLVGRVKWHDSGEKARDALIKIENT